MACGVEMGKTTRRNTGTKGEVCSLIFFFPFFPIPTMLHLLFPRDFRDNYVHEHVPHGGGRPGSQGLRWQYLSWVQVFNASANPPVLTSKYPLRSVSHSSQFAQPLHHSQQLLIL